MLTRHLWTCLLAACCLTGSVLAQAPAPPAQDASEADRASTARKRALFVLNRHIRAVGGEDVIRNIEFITIRGTVEIGGAPFVGSVVSMRSEPPRLVTRLELGPIGTIVQGYDGQVAWTVHPSAGPALLKGPDAVSMIRSANVRGDLLYEQIYSTIEYQGEGVFEGESVFVIRLIDHDGVETTEYYSKGAGTRVGVSGTRSTAAGMTPYTRVLTNYTEHERLMAPMTTVERIGEQVITVRLKDISFARLDPSVFEAPEPIRALLEAPAEEPTSGDASP